MIGIIYRHHINNFSDFKIHFSQQLLKLSKQKFIIAGDFNINLLQAKNDHNIADYVHSVVSAGCQVHINKHTRITKTLLDHVYSNYQPDKVVNKIVLSELSPNDHFQLFPNFINVKSKEKSLKKFV